VKSQQLTVCAMARPTSRYSIKCLLKIYKQLYVGKLKFLLF
jgi:hypothetical protein